MALMPSTASVTNQRTMIGPNSLPTLAVPRLWMTKRPARMVTVSGTMYPPSVGATITNPSSAPRTDIAGVIMLSP